MVKSTELSIPDTKTTLSDLTDDATAEFIKAAGIQGYSVAVRRARLDALITFAETASISTASEVSQIPMAELRMLTRQSWWRSALKALEVVILDATRLRINALTNTALNLLSDRLENGDIVSNRNKDGEVVETARLPLHSKNLAAILDSLTKSRLRIIDDLAGVAMGKDINERLIDLAADCIRVSNGIKSPSQEQKVIESPPL